ncbi:MAG: HD domain-containing protein [Acidobacteria bacterium]|nr:HD domain-containing protein [Acidobacteriota bacterium]
MKSPYVSELEPNQVISAIFLVQSKDIRQKKSGEPYLSLMLGDRTGDVEAKMWDNVSDVMHTFERDDFVKVKALYQIYQNRPQLTLHKLAKMDEREVDFADFFPASSRNPDEMFAELCGIVSEMRNPHLKALLELMFADERIAGLYKIAPAAKVVHHAYLSGLIEHVLSVCKLARMTAGHYAHVDVDLVLTGAMLHDIGKIEELTYDRGFGYSSEGQLIGHIVMGIQMIGEKLRLLPDFPPRLRTLVEHMILSHHGELEYGSPKVPLFAEALLLHHLDNLDSKMECMRALVEKDRHVDGCWTSYSTSLDRAVLKKARYLDPANGTPAAAEATPRPTVLQPVAVAASRPAPPPRTSIFGDKLKQALRPEAPK